MNTSAVSSSTQNSKIIVKLFSYDTHLIGHAIFLIKNALVSSGVITRGPIPIPTRRKVFTVNRSPHIDKKSREHFEIITHIKLLALLNCDDKVTKCLSCISLPNGVEIKIRCCDSVDDS